ncbi:MAG: serine hydrolase domain-containing protein, partial [Pseudomonadota bacterium]
MGSKDVMIEGWVDPSLTRVKEAFEANLDLGLEQGAAFSVVADGRVVVDLWGGFADAAAERPWRRDTIVTVQSVTKGIVALAVAMLVDRGKLDYDAPVATWWPEFAAGDKQSITLGQIMSHQAGLNTVREDLALDDLYHGDRFVRCLEAMEPIYPPGSMCVYHALSYGYLAGEIIRLVDGRSVGRYIAEEIASPLDASIFLGLSEAHDHRAAEIIAGPGADDVMEEATRSDLTRGYVNPRVRPTEPNTRAWRAAEVPAGSANADALSLARLYGALALGGTLDSVCLVRPATLALATAERFDGTEAGFGWPMRYGAGFMLNKDEVFGPHRDAFGHSGWGGYVAYADPANRLG